jgi:hypothetical protein
MTRACGGRPKRRFAAAISSNSVPRSRAGTLRSRRPPAVVANSTFQIRSASSMVMYKTAPSTLVSIRVASLIIAHPPNALLDYRSEVSEAARLHGIYIYYIDRRRLTAMRGGFLAVPAGRDV